MRQQVEKLQKGLDESGRSEGPRMRKLLLRLDAVLEQLQPLQEGIAGARSGFHSTGTYETRNGAKKRGLTL